ncbi:hypothetical protein EG347_07015 [Chryseobacterium sp. G0186]|nr:hypothetical protein EG347_07015 [Chryseobacterium sp. G0186]
METLAIIEYVCKVKIQDKGGLFSIAKQTISLKIQTEKKRPISTQNFMVKQYLQTNPPNGKARDITPTSFV